MLTRTKSRERSGKRSSPSDVKSHYDFNTLQIAFAHVWTQIFDGQLDSLGRELYHKYVELKDFAGSTAPDLEISTLADLKKLIEKVKSLTAFTDDSMPGDGKDTSTQIQTTPPNGWTVPFFTDPATGIVVWSIEAILNELTKAGTKPRLRWTDFDGRQLYRSQDRIIAKV